MWRLHDFGLLSPDDGGGGAGNADDNSTVSGASSDSVPTGDSGESTHDSFPAWMQQNKGELKAHETLKQYQTINDLSTAHLELLGKLAEDKRIELPSKDAGDDAWKAFYKKLGKPEKYEIPEDLGKKPYLEGLDGVYDRLNLTEDQAKGLTEYLKTADERIFANDTAERRRSYDSAIKTARDQWGPDYDRNIGLMQKVVNTFGGEQLKQALQSTGADNKFEVMHALAQIGRLLGPGYFTTGTITPEAPTRGLKYKSEI